MNNRFLCTTLQIESCRSRNCLRNRPIILSFLLCIPYNKEAYKRNGINLLEHCRLTLVIIEYSAQPYRHLPFAAYFQAVALLHIDHFVQMGTWSEFLRTTNMETVLQHFSVDNILSASSEMIYSLLIDNVAYCLAKLTLLGCFCVCLLLFFFLGQLLVPFGLSVQWNTCFFTC